MTATGQKTAVVPMLAGPMYTAGDASTIPDGYTRGFRNHVIRPNRFDGRAPFVYDSLMSVVSFLRWEDLTSQITKGLAIDASQNLRTKNADGNGYTATVVAGTPSGRLTDYANFLGKVYAVFDDGAGLPTSAAVYDGSTISTSPFNTAISARAITPFIERLFLAYPRLTILNRIAKSFSTATALGVTYDMTRAEWVKTNVVAVNQTTTGTTVSKVTPTSTAASACMLNYDNAYNLSPNAINQQFMAMCHLRNWHPTYNVPITLETYINAAWQAVATYVAGSVVTVGGFWYECKTGGVSAAVIPAFNTIVGTDTVDNTVTWTNRGIDTINALEDFVPPGGDWIQFELLSTLPPVRPTINIGLRLKFYNSIATALTTLTTLDVSLKDGLTDGDPKKANYGWQVTAGDYYFPFFNQETTLTATVNVDAIVWSEIDEPKRILAKNDFTLPEVAGLPTAATVVGGRYFVFKRRGLWIFRRTSDRNIPILPERPANVEVGCIGPRALDVYGDTVYFIGENGIYRMTADGDPEEICGVGMREEIMSHGSGWVESQSTYNMPFLVVEHGNREVWVYTQKSKIYIYHIPTGGWTYIDLLGAPEVRSIFYDYAGQKMLVSFGGFGATRSDDSVSASDTIDNTATPLAVGNEVLFKPLELFAPRYEAALEEVGVFHNATAVSGTIRIAYSYDRGLTWTTPPGYPVTISLTSPRIPMPVGALGPSVMVRVSRVGPGGSTNWSLSKADAKLKVLRGELPYANATT